MGKMFSLPLALGLNMFPSSLNETNIFLIPKCDQPTSMKDLRPISLCNVVYKIGAKVLANRLKYVLSKCISEEQYAFIEGRSILDNALVATEVIHYMRCKANGKVGDVALKIDISKAYDRVYHGYLHCMMIKLDFHLKWVSWIMLCVQSVNYSVSMNQDCVGPIQPSRGPRQGDPLSTYQFLICPEGLSTLIKKEEERGSLHGAKICRGAPVLSHLLLTDDCFLFFEQMRRKPRLCNRFWRSTPVLLSNISICRSLKFSLAKTFLKMLSATLLGSWMLGSCWGSANCR